MNSENWKKVEELLNSALEIEPANRQKFLDQISAEDLRREVESLLDAERKAEKFLTFGAIAFAADFFDDDDMPDALAGRKIGNYKIVGELGRGGMGAVYLAQRDDGKFQQQVAVKLLKRELNTADIRRRFQRERQILAALAHPNIARLLDAGTTDDGLPYLVMEYVEGLPVDEFCERENLDLEERLQIFRTVCDAVAFAHRTLIVHRDLKPSNILVTQDGIPKLLDFGISKLLTPEFEAESAHTITKLGAMTPEYASPEQLRGESVTTATDVYSLGIILYELLTNYRPFELKKHSVEEIIRAVCETEPERPSSFVLRYSSFSASCTTQPNEQRTKDKRLRTKPQSLRGDLDNIILKALKKKPDRRYASVEQFSEDIRRHLADLPVLARPDTLSYRAVKFVNRNRVAVFAGLLVFLTLIGGIVATVWQARRAEANRARAEKRFADVRGLSNALLNDIAPKIERLSGATEARQALVNQSLKYLDGLASESQDDLALQSELAAAYEKIGDLQGNPNNPNLIDWEAAIASYEKARAIRLKLSEKNPSGFESQKFLAENYRVAGKIYGQANDFQNELQNLEAALAVYEKLLAAAPESNELPFALAQVNHDIGRNFSSSRRYVDAILYFEKATAALETLRLQNPNNTDILRLLGDCRAQLALSLSWELRQAEAETQAAQAREIFVVAAALNPNDANVRAGLWSGYWFSSLIYEEVDDPLSHEYALKALWVVEEIVRADAANIRAKAQLSKTFWMVGHSANNTGKYAEAVSYLEKGRDVLVEITESRSKNYGLRTDLTTVLMSLGDAKLKQEKFADALLYFEQAEKIHHEVLQNFAGDVRVSRNLAATYEWLAETHEKIGGNKNQAARENYQKCLAILLQLEDQNLLSKYDREFLEKTKERLKKFDN